MGRSETPTRGPGEWTIPDDALATTRRPSDARHPVAASEVDGAGLATLLDEPGPVVVVDGDGARQAWDDLPFDISTDASSATSIAMIVKGLREAGSPGKLLLVDCTGEGLHPETLLRGDLSAIRVGILARSDVALSEAAAARCRIVRVPPRPTPAP